MTTIGAPDVAAFTVVFIVLSPLIASHSSPDAFVPMLARIVTTPALRLGAWNAEAELAVHNATSGESFIFFGRSIILGFYAKRKLKESKWQQHFYAP